jgi:hypothetical protein
MDDEGRMAWRYVGNLEWEAVAAPVQAEAAVEVAA